MIHANFYRGSRWPFFRQTRLGIWRNVQFSTDNLDAEWQIVGSPMPDLAPILGKRILYCQTETPDYYLPADLSACEAVISPVPLNHPRCFIAPPPLQWMYGVNCDLRPNDGHVFSEHGLTLDNLLEAPPPEKTKLCSLIVSGKGFLPGHQLRVDFVHQLIAHFGDAIDLYGFGHRPIPDKRDALDPYRFSIALENSAYPNYWTEKLADVFLGFTMPIYYGAPNISQFFPEQALFPINIADPDSAIRAIESGISYCPEAITEARRRVLLEYNAFALIATALQNAPQLCQDAF